MFSPVNKLDRFFYQQDFSPVNSMNEDHVHAHT